MRNTAGVGSGAPPAGAAGQPGAAAGMGAVAGMGAGGMTPVPEQPTAGTGAAGMGMTPGMPQAGSSGMAAPPDAGTEPATDAMAPNDDLGAGDGHDVITIGDSWMNLGLYGIQQSLVRVSGQPYRTYGVAGTRLLNGQIPGQYDQAKLEDPDIKTVVMTAGGNDVLLTGLSAACASGSQTCLDRLVEIGEALETMWAEMAADGVRDVIYIMYSMEAGDGLHPSLMHNERLMTACDGVPEPLDCHLLFTDDSVGADLMIDNVHPSREAYDRLGQAVYDLMVAEGMRR